jgi:hypothetical protein
MLQLLVQGVAGRPARLQVVPRQALHMRARAARAHQPALGGLGAAQRAERGARGIRPAGGC